LGGLVKFGLTEDVARGGVTDEGKERKERNDV
jgi:hypothetical protein